MKIRNIYLKTLRNISLIGVINEEREVKLWQ